MAAAAGGSRSGRGRRRKRPGNAARGGGGVGGQGRGGVGAAGTARPQAGANADGGVGSAAGRNRFRGYSAPPAGSESSRELGGPRQPGRQVVELAPGSPAGPWQSGAEGQPPCVPRGGPGTGGPARVAPRSAAPSGARRAALGPAARGDLGGAGRCYPPLAWCLPAQCLPDSGSRKVIRKGDSSPGPHQIPRPGRSVLVLPSHPPPFPEGEALWTRGLNHHFTSEPKAGLTFGVSPVEVLGGCFSLLFYLCPPYY